MKIFPSTRLYAILPLLLLAILTATHAQSGPAPDAQPSPDAVREDRQAMRGVPMGLTLETPTHYSFGTAAAPDGSIWFTEFNRQTLQRYDPKSGAARIERTNIPGIHGIAIDRSGNIFLGCDLGDANHPGKVLRLDARSGAIREIITGITRPRQVACDRAGNAYVICESGSRYSLTPSLLKWDRITGKVSVVINGLRTPEGVAIADDGTIFINEYGTLPDARAGRVLARDPRGKVKVLARGFWRARGLALQGTSLYVAAEADYFDHGNSGVLARIDTRSGKVTRALQGIDYPQFPCTGRDGRIYVIINRDSFLAAYDPNAKWTRAVLSDKSLQIATSGGTFSPAPKDANLRLEVGGVVVAGKVTARPGSRVRGWIRLPASRFSAVQKTELYPDTKTPDYAQPGLYEVPSLRIKAARASARGAVLALRQQGGKRWPMLDVGTVNERPENFFSEDPTAYLVYFDYTPRAVSAPSTRTILTRVGNDWLYGVAWDNFWQTFREGAPEAKNAAWTQVELGRFAGKKVKISLRWKTPNAGRGARFLLYDFVKVRATGTLGDAGETIGGRAFLIVPSTRLRIESVAGVLPAAVVIEEVSP